METKANTSTRAIIAATAALTIAIGLTVASLGGYLRTTPEPASQPVVVPPLAEPIVASYAPPAGHEHARHHERKHEHEDD